MNTEPKYYYFKTYGDLGVANFINMKLEELGYERLPDSVGAGGYGAESCFSVHLPTLRAEHCRGDWYAANGGQLLTLDEFDKIPKREQKVSVRLNDNHRAECNKSGFSVGCQNFYWESVKRLVEAAQALKVEGF